MKDLSDLPTLAKKNKPISIFYIDILTIAIGPEHHDIRLLDVEVIIFFLNRTKIQLEDYLLILLVLILIIYQ